MKRVFVLVLFPLLIVLSCSTMVTLTGERRQPLPKDAEVKVYNIKLPEKYEEIGYMVIRGNNIEYRFNEAKKIAREYGGNGILPKEEEKKERTWQEEEYDTVYEKDSITGIMQSKKISTGYKRKHEEWVEQGFVIIYVY